MLNENILSLFIKKERELKNQICLRYKSKKNWKVLSWSDVKEKIVRLASALEKLGVKSQDKVAILSNTRYEWTLADLAILSLGAVTVPIYHSTLPKDVRYVLEHSESKVIFVENRQQLKKIEEIQKELPLLKKVILIESVNGDEFVTFKKMIEQNENRAEWFEKKVASIENASLATIVYTSGTTGEPKGVMLTHQNFASAMDAIHQIVEISPDEEGLLFLPLAHILAREIQFFQLTKGFIHSYAENIDKLIDNIKEIKPHFMVCVPRIFEKIYSKILNDVENSNILKKKLFYWALEVGTAVSEAKRKNLSIPILTSIQYQIAHKLVFSKLQEKLGGRVRFFISGGAPLSAEVAQFFHAADVLILEGYGLTETIAAININRPDHYRFGTVGPMVKNIEEKIAEDGEVLVRGGHVFTGYYRNEQLTKEAFTSDGYFHTGDIGEFDQDGFLKITDRKKDLIVTAAGKNVAPQYIENILKTDPLFSNVMVHGDRRKFLSALVTLNPDELMRLAQSHQVKPAPFEELIVNPKISSLVHKRIEEKNRQLASFEGIKRFAILPKEFTVEGGELTPTLKIKRKLVTEKYKHILDSFYKE